ncbi:MAG: hypothetical protein JWO95_2487 [Verrucomicrobiales bacterium]|nr:hypothetical protein [Verrucomicrobiales bacterium]
MREPPLPDEPPLDVPAPELPAPELPEPELPAPELPELPLLLGELDELPEPCTPLLLFVLRLEPELEPEPDGSLMLLPREPDDPLDEPPEDIPDPDDPDPDDPLPPLPWSLPLQPTNNAAAPAIANSFFIIGYLPCQQLLRPRPCSIGRMLYSQQLVSCKRFSESVRSISPNTPESSR